MIKVAALLILVCILVGIYLYLWARRFWGMFRSFSEKKRTLFAVFTSAAGIYIAWPVYRLGGMVLAYFLVICFLLEFVHLFVKKVLKKEGRVWNFLYQSGLLSLGITLLIMVYGLVNMQIVHEKRYELSTQKQIDDLRIGAISDLHLGNTMDAEKLKGYCDEIEANQIDLFALVGDIFDENTTKEEMLAGCKVLGEVKSTYGTYYVLGNHDPNTFKEKQNYTRKEMVDAMKQAGIHVLEDEVVQLKQLNIVGRKDASESDRKAIGTLLKEIQNDNYTLVLDHQPVELEESKTERIDLQLSGHTHAGQIWPTGYILKKMGVHEFTYGHKKEGNMDLIVTSGIGGWGYPIRTVSQCEYLICEISNRSLSA